jgi:hypothetical protein
MEIHKNNCFVTGSSCYYDKPDEHKIFTELSKKVAKMILKMQKRDQIGEIAWLIRESYDNYVAAETDNDPIETLKHEWNLK